MAPWLRQIAELNPAAFILEGVRVVLGAFAIRGMQRVGVQA